MIAPDYVRTMAAYNAEMNRRLYASAGRLDEAARRMDRGAFWRSVHGTLAHLVWADRQWMSRFDGWAPTTRRIADSGTDERPFAMMEAERVDMDAQLLAWAGRVDTEWLAGELTWFSGAADREMSKPRSLLVVHMFNHQTHHRGQAHAMLTAAGESTGATDLPWVI